jgi:basic amino acid/polyamine antiporter, APA family
MSMSRDGLLPARFSKIHPKYRTPSFATVVTGFVVAIPALFLNLSQVTDLTSIGTLFAFVVVCSGILILNIKKQGHRSGFSVPYINGKYIVPLLAIAATGIGLALRSQYWLDLTYINAEKISALVFVTIMYFMAYLSFRKNLSLIPVLGLLSCLFLMSQLGFTNWMRFIIWLATGVIIYFNYSIKNSHLNRK